MRAATNPSRACQQVPLLAACRPRPPAPMVSQHAIYCRPLTRKGRGHEGRGIAAWCSAQRLYLCLPSTPLLLPRVVHSPEPYLLNRPRPRILLPLLAGNNPRWRRSGVGAVAVQSTPPSTQLPRYSVRGAAQKPKRATQPGLDLTTTFWGQAEQDQQHDQQGGSTTANRAQGQQRTGAAPHQSLSARGSHAAR